MFFVIIFFYGLILFKVNVTGIIRYVGPTNLSDRIWLGIEFEEPVGRSDGRFDKSDNIMCHNVSYAKYLTIFFIDLFKSLI